MEVSNNNNNNNNDNNMNWMNSLKNYLSNDILKMLIPVEEVRNKMVTEEAMEIWKVVFTHQSYNINLGNNYEEYELLGDRFLDANFVYYMKKRCRNQISVSDLSEIKRFYMSKTYQSRMSQYLKLDQYVRVGENIQVNTHIAEDMIESFCGGLIEIADKFLKPGTGNLLCYNLVVELFKNVEIDYSVAKGAPKTQVKEIFDKLSWGKPIERDYTSSNELVKFSIYFTDEAIDYLEKKNIIVDSNLIASAEGTSKKIASDAAYVHALKNLRNMGITESWIEQQRIKEDYSNKELAPLFPQVQQKFSQHGYQNIYFKTAQTTRMGKIMQLVGVKSNGKEDILVQTPDPIRRNVDGKKYLLNEYINLK